VNDSFNAAPGPTRHRWYGWTCLAALWLVTGCHRDNIQVYRVAKDQNPAPPQTAPALPVDSPNPSLPPGHPDISTMPGGAAGAAATALTWKTPAGWMEMTPGEMRVASFKITGANGQSADVSVIPLPGMAGTDPANVNRWRGQVGLAPVPDEELQAAAESVVAGGLPAQLYDLVGTNSASGNAERILGVIQHRPDGNSWFYKMTGDADLVEQQKPAFIEFLKSLNFGPQAATQTELPPGHPAIGGMTASSASATTARPTWQPPADWREVPPAQFLLAEYTIAGTNGAQAEVNVAQLAGDGGGLLANVNRWRQQIGLDAVDETELAALTTSLPVSGGQATVVDLSGTDLQTGRPTRLVGVIVPENDRTWFYKLMGDTSVVQSQKAAFLQFVQGVKY